MITDLTNLGPSLRGTAGLGAERTKGLDKPFELDSQKQASTSSFDSILKTKVSDAKADEKVTASAKAEPRMDRPERQVKKETVIPKNDGDRVRISKDARSEIAEDSQEPEIDSDEMSKFSEEKVDVKGETGKTGKDEKIRQEVMLEFMDSMESEFGIPPEEIVEAMTEIPNDQIFKSPEKTASLVIEKLDLPAEDEQRAMELYVGMLEQLKQTQAPPTLFSKAQVAAAGMATGGAALGSQGKREALNNSLDRLNEQFFLRGQYAPQIKSQADPTQQMANQTMAGRFGQMQSAPQDALAMKPNQMPELPMNQAMPNAKNALPLEGMEQIDPDSQEGKALLSALAALGASAAALEKGMPKDPQTLQALKNEQMMNQLKADGIVATSMLAGGGENVTNKAVAAMGMGAEADDDPADLTDSDQFFVHQDTQAHKGQQRDLGQIGDKDFAVALGGAGAAKAGGGNEAVNVQHLMKQAQYLLKKGGGEAKIQMAPEGIGQVHMKMTLLDGKVNLEMQAETKEAKKLIESSMGELRTQLGHHNLTMDQVKVDVGNQTSADLRGDDSQKRNFDSQQEPSKDQTRNFWNQFNGNGTGGFERRNQFNDSTGIRAYGGTKREEPLKAVDTSVTPATKASGSGKGRGLNLVA